MTEKDTATNQANVALGGVVLAAAFGAAYALAVEPYRLEVTQVPVPCPKLPAELDGLTLLLLADPHISRWGRRERLLARILDALPTPDIAVVTGDLIEGARGIPLCCELVRKHVRARQARYGILGNAEHKLKGWRRRRMVRQLEDAGLRMLVNRSEPLTVRGVAITVAGTDDPFSGQADLAATLAGALPGRFCLLLAHSPQIVPRAARMGVDVMLSGHTHGGQVRLPLIGPLNTHNPLGRKMDAGTFDRTRLTEVLGRDPGGDLVLYVSRGVGVAGLAHLPIYPRLLCRPEIAWLTLHRV